MTVMSYRIDIFRRLNMCGRYYFDGDTYRLVGRVIEDCQYAVSYTHLDVYKRQGVHSAVVGGAITRPQDITKKFVKVLNK